MSCDVDSRGVQAAPVTGNEARQRPLFLCGVSAGFPSPADDYLDRRLDLHEHLVPHPDSTFFLRASGSSMLGAGIHDGDLLVVDRSLQGTSGRVVIAVVDGELTVKRLVMREGKTLLVPENPDFTAQDVTGREDVWVWGVVTSVVHKL